MKNYLLAGMACIIAAMAMGIDPVLRFVNETSNRGTLKGVENCIEYEQSELISEESVKALCVQKFHRPLYLQELATGKAGLRAEGDAVSLEGKLENKTPNHVTTWVKLLIFIIDDEGKEKEVFAETSIWIDPTSEAEFKLEFPDLAPKEFENLAHCEEENSAPMSCFGWSIAEIMGLAI